MAQPRVPQPGLLPGQSRLREPPSIRLPLVALIALIGACTGVVSKEYTYTRSTPAIGRSSPTTFIVRLSVDSVRRQVIWFADVHDEEGDLGRTTHTWEACTILDSRNWECPPVAPPPDYQTVHQVSMRNGQLFEYYWSDERQYKTKHRILGIGF